MRTIAKFPFFLADALAGSLARMIPGKRFEAARVRRILVFQLGGIGDVLLAFPAIQVLCRDFPGEEISLVSEFGEELADLLPSSCRIREIHRYEPQGRHRHLWDKVAFFGALRDRRFDLVVNFNRGNILRESSWMAFFLGAEYRLGFFKGTSGLLNNIRLEFRYDRYILQQNLDLLGRIGSVGGSSSIPLRLPETARTFALEVLRKNGVGEGDLLVALHPGGKFHVSLKMWPLERYRELARRISSGYQARVLLLGDAQDKERFSSLLEKGTVIDLLGRTTIPQLAAFIERCDLFIGNDSGPLHLAVALNRPSIGIFGGTDPVQLMPAGRENLTILAPRGRPAYFHQVNYRTSPPGTDLFEGTSLERVLEEGKRLLGRSER